MKNKIINIQKIGFQWETESPFLAVMHHVDRYPAGNEQQGPVTSLSGRDMGQDFSAKDGFSMYHGQVVPGFPAHPHRGFETITIVEKGSVDHFDSMGAEGRYGNGDVQWLTTGNGCQHAEMFPLIHQDKDNPLELFQIWFNLPSQDKMTDPDYKMLWSEEIPVMQITSPNGNIARVKLVSGNFQGVNGLDPTQKSWAYNRDHHVGIMAIEMDPESEIVLPAVSETLLRNLYFYNGTGFVLIDGLAVKPAHRIKISGSDEIRISNGGKVSQLLLLEGEPINEPVVQYGPFVMNTSEEIKKAFDDYRATEFGGWPWKEHELVQDRKTGRFARHSDGRMEVR